MIWEFTILAKLFQKFHPMGAAQKHAVADTASSNAKRTGARYHSGSVYDGRLNQVPELLSCYGPSGHKFLFADQSQRCAFREDSLRFDIPSRRFTEEALYSRVN